jgi:hypothetical protein
MESRRHSCVINFYVLWGAAGEQLESNWKDNKKLTRFISYWQCKPKAIASNHSSANRTEMGGQWGWVYRCYSVGSSTSSPEPSPNPRPFHRSPTLCGSSLGYK